MHPTRRTVVSAGCATAVAAAWPALAQGRDPARPVEMIVPWGPGGGADQLARKVGKMAEPILGQAMPVVNVPGGTGATGMAKLLANPADGYSAAIYIADAHALLAGAGARWSAADIVPVAVLVQAPSFLFVAKDSRFKGWAEFEAEARANPGKLKVATLGFGSVDDFTLSVLAAKGVKVVQVPFSKPSERYVSILGGHADALYEQAGDVGSFLAGDQMRPLAVFGAERSAAFKEVPSSKELGYDVSLPQFRSVVVRAGTPPERVKALSDTLAKVAADGEFKAFLKEAFADEASFLPAEAAGPYLARQLEDMRAAATRA